MVKRDGCMVKRDGCMVKRDGMHGLIVDKHDSCMQLMLYIIMQACSVNFPTNKQIHQH